MSPRNYDTAPSLGPPAFTQAKHVQLQDHQEGDADHVWARAEVLWTITAHDTSPSATVVALCGPPPNSPTAKALSEAPHCQEREV